MKLDALLDKNNEEFLSVDKKKLIIHEWERVYATANRKNLPNSYFADLSEENAKELVLHLLRFVIKKYLRWRPEDVSRYMTMRVLKKMKLDKLVKTYLPIPDEYNKSGMDATYLVSLLYPKKFEITMEDECLKMLDNIQKGNIKKFPSEWMNSIDGIERFRIILCYVISNMPRFRNKEELYAYFASLKGTKFLKEQKIYNFAISLYPTVLEAVHYSLPDDIKSDFLFHYFRFKKGFRFRCNADQISR